MTQTELLAEVSRFGVQCALVSRAPNILLIAMDIGGTGYREFADGSVSLDHLAKAVGPNGHIIINPWWYMVGHGTWAARLKRLKTVFADPAAARLHFFCNAPAEVAYLTALGFHAVLLNHNTFAHEDVFDVIDTAKEFSAIYNAKFISFKRHELARNIDNLALIYSRYGDPASYAQHIRQVLPHAHYLNGDTEAGSYVAFSPRQVAQHLNAARVGLCLSQTEGAMYGSIEYLLCGLPVVSTHSLGGRELFFDDRFCRIVQDTPEAVAAAVAELGRQNLDPHFIRAETLKKIEASRRAFVAFINGLQQGTGLAPAGDEALRHIMSVDWACWRYLTIGDVERYFAA